VIHGVTGLLVDPSSPETISDALVRLLSNPELAKGLGHEGRARVVRDFTWARAGERVHAILEDVVRGRGNHACARARRFADFGARGDI
jgi:glycosyltransferase involved in cell wall biosynthesis